ncbi:MAG: ribosome-associated translation inhibitor RaiA, partial [Lachnospiraceae bacterium]|nr:ribosome-associated translation inhibitor RaiA [Lachnospiraceae bacterium]
MKFNITGRNINVGDKTEELIIKKLGKLGKFFKEDTVANVTLSTQKDDITIEITIPTKGTIIRAEERSSDLLVSLDLVEEVLERQIRRHRTRL